MSRFNNWYFMKSLITALFLFFVPSVSIAGGSFSTIFGSEGSSSITNSKARSLSYSLQYLTLSGAIGYTVSQMYETGFFEPFGLLPDNHINLSPLAYDKSKSFLKSNNLLRESKNEINRLNEFFSQKELKLSNSPTFSSISKQNLTNMDYNLIKERNRERMITRYFDEK